MFKKLSPKSFALVLLAVLLVSVGIVATLGSLNNPQKQVQNSNSNSTNNNSISGIPNNNSATNPTSASEVKTLAPGGKITEAEFTKHFNKNDCWIRFEKKVYNITNYLAIHPGGEKSISRFCSREVDAVSTTHPGGPFGSIKIQNILTPFYVGEME